VILAGQHHDRTVLGRAREVAMLERVAAAVDTGSLPVPDRGDAVPVGVRMPVQHLGAHVRRSGQFLIACRHERHVMRRQEVGNPG